MNNIESEDTVFTDTVITPEQKETLRKIFDSEIKTDEDYLALAEICDEEE